MAVNLYTDSRYMETFNLWHLFTLIVLSTLYLYLDGDWKKLLLTIFLTLLIGLVIENVKAIRISPGDTKMFIVSAVFLLLTTNLKTVFVAILPFFIMKVYLALFIVTFVVFVLLYDKLVKNTIKGEGSFRFLSYQITIKMAEKKLPKVNLNIPATGGILISVITLLLVF